jgi:hypothetical protein
MILVIYLIIGFILSLGLGMWGIETGHIDIECALFIGVLWPALLIASPILIWILSIYWIVDKYIHKD